LRSLAGLAKETGAKPVTVAELPRGRDLVVVTIAIVLSLTFGVIDRFRPVRLLHF